MLIDRLFCRNDKDSFLVSDAIRVKIVRSEESGLNSAGVEKWPSSGKRSDASMRGWLWI